MLNCNLHLKRRYLFDLGEGGNVYEKDLAPNLDFIENNRDKLLNEYRNKYLLVHEGNLVGSYDTYELAAAEGIRTFGLEGLFLVHHLLEEEPVNFILEAAL